MGPCIICDVICIRPETCWQWIRTVSQVSIYHVHCEPAEKVDALPKLNYYRHMKGCIQFKMEWRFIYLFYSNAICFKLLLLLLYMNTPQVRDLFDFFLMFFFKCSPKLHLFVSETHLKTVILLTFNRTVLYFYIF